MKKIFKDNLFFFGGFILFILLTVIIFYFYDKVERILFLNEGIHPTYDFLFKNITHIGDKYFWIISIFVLSTFTFRKAFIMGFAGVINAIIVFSLKYSIPNNFRPVKYFQENNLDLSLLKLTEGVEIKLLYSFPSGHSSMAFCTFAMLAFFSKNNFLKFIFFFIALLSSFSRIYLYQHFLEDVFMGSIIGTLASFFSLYYLNKSKLLEKEIFSKKLFSFIKK